MKQIKWAHKDYTASQAGMVAVAALVLLLVVLAVVLSLAAVTATESKIAASQRDGAAAQYLAEAGAKHAVAMLSDDTNFPGESRSFPELGGNAAYKTTVAAEAGDIYSRVITADATVGSATRRVVLTVTLPHSGAVNTTSFQKALFAGGWMLLLGGVTVDGDIHANGLRPFYWWGAVHGTVSGPPVHIDFPTTNAADYNARATVRANDTVDIGENRTQRLSAGSLWYIDGNLVMRHGSRLVVEGNGPVTIFVNGGVWLDHAILPDNVLLIATDSIVMVGTSVRSGIILSQDMVFVYGSVWQQVNISGLVLGRSFIGVFDNVHITYDNTMLQNPQNLPPGFPTGTAVIPFAVKSWSNSRGQQ